jgi:hypothetical protein
MNVVKHLIEKYCSNMVIYKVLCNWTMILFSTSWWLKMDTMNISASVVKNSSAGKVKLADSSSILNAYICDDPLPAGWLRTFLSSARRAPQSLSPSRSRQRPLDLQLAQTETAAVKWVKCTISLSQLISLLIFLSQCL